MTTHDRYHGLDALRAFAMLLGVALHAAIAYLHTPPDFWPVKEPSDAAVLDVLLLAVHNFRLPTFFLLSGFFAALLYDRRGAAGLIRNRLLRVGLPLLLVMLTVQPLLLIIAAAAKQLDDPGAAIREHFASGKFVERWVPPLHLWFLWYLLMLLAVGAPAAALLERLPGRGAVRWLLGGWGAWFLLGLGAAAWLTAMPQPFGADTPLGWRPNGPVLGYYGGFMFVGAAFYRHRDLLPNVARRGLPYLIAAHCGFFALGTLALISLHISGADPFPDHSRLRFALAFVFGQYAALTTAGLVGLSLRYLSRPRPWVRWLADSAYWCYLASLVPILLLQMAFVGAPIPPEVKALLATAGSMALLLASYQFFVRRTWLGRLLNGPPRLDTPGKASDDGKEEPTPLAPLPGGKGEKSQDLGSSAAPGVTPPAPPSLEGGGPGG